MPMPKRLLRFVVRNVFDALEGFGVKAAPEAKERVDLVVAKMARLEKDQTFRESLGRQVEDLLRWIEEYSEQEVRAE